MKEAIYHHKWTDFAQPYELFEIELCFSGEILLKGTKICMPEVLRKRTMYNLLAPEGHPGISKMKQRIQTKVWWPKIDAQAEEYVKKCLGCMMTAAPQPPEPMKRKELPSEPWQHIAIDFLDPLPSGDYLFVIMDYYSRFIEVEIMRKTDSAETIKR